MWFFVEIIINDVLCTQSDSDVSNSIDVADFLKI